MGRRHRVLSQFTSIFAIRVIVRCRSHRMVYNSLFAWWYHRLSPHRRINLSLLFHWRRLHSPRHHLPLLGRLTPQSCCQFIYPTHCSTNQHQISPFNWQFESMIRRKEKVSLPKLHAGGVGNICCQRLLCNHHIFNRWFFVMWCFLFHFFLSVTEILLDEWLIDLYDTLSLCPSPAPKSPHSTAAASFSPSVTISSSVLTGKRKRDEQAELTTRSLLHSNINYDHNSSTYCVAASAPSVFGRWGYKASMCVKASMHVNSWISISLSCAFSPFILPLSASLLLPVGIFMPFNHHRKCPLLSHLRRHFASCFICHWCWWSNSSLVIHLVR